MSDKKQEDIIQAAQKIESEILAKESHLKIAVVGDIIGIVIKTISLPEFQGAWKKEIAAKFYQLTGLVDEDGRPKAEEKEFFRMNVGLAHILRLLKNEAGLRVSFWPQQRLANRQYLALEYVSDQTKKLQEYHALLETFVNKSPNFGTKQEEICARVTLSMIALDGIFMANADGLISRVMKDKIHLDFDMPMIEVPISNKDGAQLKHYFLGKYTVGCLKIMMPRATKVGKMFPDDWQMTNAHHKKRLRRVMLEGFIVELWKQTFPGRSVPEYLDMKLWIKSSRLSCVLGGVPFIGIAHLRNRLRGAQIPVEAGKDKITDSALEIEKKGVNPFQWVRSMHQIIRTQEKGDKKLKLKHIRNLAGQLKQELNQAKIDGHIDEDENILADWLLWMIGQERFKDMRLSTYQGYISSVANRVFPLPDKRSLKRLNNEQWIQMVTEIATDVDYMPSSRRAAITHLKVLNDYMHQRQLAPRIDFKNYAFRVLREIAECPVIFPHEVDELLRMANSDNLWLAILLAFYCGLRCEEICYLRPEGFENDYRFVVGRSKLPSSRRTISHGLLIPEKHQKRMNSIIKKRQSEGSTYLLEEDWDNPVPTRKLSKQMSRLLTKNNSSIQKMHALRHGFASWQLVRYYMLVDHQLRHDVRVGRFHLNLDGRHEWFNDCMLADFAELIGGVRWRIDFDHKGYCVAGATDLLMISKLLGHANRFTTLENYTNTLGWITRYYLLKREDKIICPMVVS